MRLALLVAFLCSVAFGLTIPHNVSAQTINAPAKISALSPDMRSRGEHRGSIALTDYDPDRETGPRKPVRATPDQQFDIQTTSGNGTIPVYSTIPLNANAAGMERVVIVVHGESRNAKSNWSSTVEAARMAAVTGTTLIVGPQFLVPQDIAAQQLPATVLRWRLHDWSRGWPAVSPVLSADSRYSIIYSTTLRTGRGTRTCAPLYSLATPRARNSCSDMQPLDTANKH
jgi:hypothetical protein